MSERREPFVAWMPKLATGGLRAHEWDYVAGSLERAWVVQDEREWVPVVVTPLLPDDPRPGDQMILGGCNVTVMSAVVRTPGNYERVAVTYGWSHSGSIEFVKISELSRPPVRKTFRLELPPYLPATPPRYHEIQAESKEAALAKLADALEEVR